MINIQKQINDKILALREEHNKPIESWHCSKLGSCLRGVYFERLGVKPDKEFTERELRIFDAGKMFENWVVGLIGIGETQVRVEDKSLNVSGYTDLVIEDGKEKRVIELKTKHSRSFWYMVDKGEGANRQHMYQLWLYLKLLNIPEGSIIYISKDDLTMVEFPVRLSDKQLGKEVLDELNLLNRAWKSKDPSILPLVDDKDWRARFCRFHSHCKSV